MKKLKNFEQFDYNELNESIFDSDFKNAMKNWRIAFGYRYENNQGVSYIKTLVKGLKDDLKSNKVLLQNIIEISNRIKKLNINPKSTGIGGNNFVKVMPGAEKVKKNIKENPNYYDEKAIKILKKSGIELTDDIKNKLGLKDDAQSQGQKVQETKVLNFNNFIKL